MTMSPREKVELKPCPFCGDSESVTDIFARDGRKIVCRCGASVIRFQPDASEKAASAWNRRAALASGSGDHAELIGVLRADRLPECSFDDGKTWELDGVGVAETFSRAADALEALLAENAALRGKSDFYKRDNDVLMKNTWVSRATEAERKLAEAYRTARQFLAATSGTTYPSNHPMWAAIESAQQLLSKEAERG